ncbi:MAG: 7-cyano-7-deazaguanine synthase [Elusimicrobia bacterium]|nr:7-cyano-7-deazaguanine synthase [Elusimicrobiota bacterium]
MALCGAWAVDGGELERLLPFEVRAAMLAAAGAKPGALEERLSGPLWLVADAGRLAQDADSALAVEGFLPAFEGPALGGLLKSLARDPELGLSFDGHYALAHADVARGRLRLFSDLSASEPIYYARAGGLVLFSTSARILLAHPALPRGADPDTVLEHGLLGITLFGDASPFAGVRQVLPGHRVDVTRAGIEAKWHSPQTFDPVAGSDAELADRLWRGLVAGVQHSLGRTDEAVVSLSGGVDSAAIAAALAHVLGPDKVHAFTYSFEGIPESSELREARATCRRLGIRRHTEVSFTREDMRAAAPEAIGFQERVASWGMSSLELLVARAIAARGYSSYFSGTGIGGLQTYFQEIAEGWRAAPGLMEFYWKRACRDHRSRWKVLSSLHPALDTRSIMMPTRFIPVLCVLKYNGVIESLAGYFPGALDSVAVDISERPRVREAIERTRALPLERQLQFHGYVNLHVYDDRGRKDKISRLAGARKISPFYFPACWPLAALPRLDRPGFRDARRWHKSGKRILREAMRTRLPEEVVFRRKVKGENGPPEKWHIPIAREWEPSLAASIGALEPLFGGRWRDLRPYFDSHLLPLAQWHSIFYERRPEPVSA